MKWTLTAIAALAVIPSIAVAQNTDTTMRDTVQTSSEGRLGEPMNVQNHGLTTKQVKELQRAIKKNGCTVGSVSGTFDSQTTEGVECIRQKKNIQSDNLNEVLRALNLSFTASDSLLSPSGAPGMTGQPTTTDTTTMDTTTTQRDTSTMRSDTSMTRDTSMTHDTTSTRSDTSTMPTDTTMHRDTSSTSTDTTMMRHDTTSVRHP